MSEERVYLTQRELAARWRLSGRTLERWRAEPYGPAWVNIGGSIRYPMRDIEEFEQRNRNTAGRTSGAVTYRGGSE